MFDLDCLQLGLEKLRLVNFWEQKSTIISMPWALLLCLPTACVTHAQHLFRALCIGLQQDNSSRSTIGSLTLQSLQCLLISIFLTLFHR